ncbi:MAG: T9SS type A sorting domain-containing protein [Bacteroidota bacterium]
MRFFTFLVILLGLILGNVLPTYGQGYKSYLVFEDDRKPQKLTANEIIPLRDESDFVIAGAIKQGAPNFTAMAYLMRINPDGYQSMNSGLFTTQLNTQHQINLKSICQDGSGNFVLGGSTNQNPGSAGGERMLNYVSDKGKVLNTVGQSEHDFVSVVWDENQDYVVALSNNDGNVNPETDIMLSQYDKNGNLINHNTLSTSTKDNAVKLVSTTNGYVAVASSDTDNIPQVLVAYFDEDLNLIWANQYQNADFAHEVSDVTTDGSGNLLISGSSISIMSGEETGFLIGLENDGSEQFYYNYFLGGDEQVRFTGLTRYTTNVDGRDRGYLLAGSYNEFGSAAERRSFVLNLRADGSVVWGKTYSVFSPWTDFEFDEELSDILFIPNSTEFMTLGSISRYIKGSGALDFRAAMVVRSNVINGNIDVQDGDCASELEFFMGSHSFQAFPVGTLYQNLTPSTLSFAERELDWELRYCSYSLSGRPNQVGGEHPFDFQIQTSDANTANFRLQGPTDWQTASLELYDIRGAKLGDVAVSNGQTQGQWELPKVSPGVYLVRLKVQGQYYASRKLLIQ